MLAGASHSLNPITYPTYDATFTQFRICSIAAHVPEPFIPAGLPLCKKALPLIPGALAEIIYLSLVKRHGKIFPDIIFYSSRGPGGTECHGVQEMEGK